MAVKNMGKIYLTAIKDRSDTQTTAYQGLAVIQKDVADGLIEEEQGSNSNYKPVIKGISTSEKTKVKIDDVLG